MTTLDPCPHTVPQHRTISEHREAVRALLRSPRRGREDDAARPVPLAAAGRVLAEYRGSGPATPHELADGRLRGASASPHRAGQVTLRARHPRRRGRPGAPRPGTRPPWWPGAVLPREPIPSIPVDASCPRASTPTVTVAAADVPRRAARAEASSDVARGEVALPAGTVLGAAALGACAALGSRAGDGAARSACARGQCWRGRGRARRQAAAAGSVHEREQAAARGVAGHGAEHVEPAARGRRPRVPHGPPRGTGGVARGPRGHERRRRRGRLEVVRQGLDGRARRCGSATWTCSPEVRRAAGCSGGHPCCACRAIP
ncbi:hypothetical protein QJS66_20205 [Kocuria rhizophila]|nr:hypothetical protein QJS66_20205 [Kocuria rhizophila]